VTAPHFFVSTLGDVGSGGTVQLSPEDSRHALRSLRLRPGEDVSLADGSGRFARGGILRDEDGIAVVEVLELESVEQPAPRVVVAMAPPKGDRLAWAVQKLAEVGVDDLLLVADAQRAIRRPSRGDRERVAEGRLERIAREAAMQSRRPFVMSVGWTSLEEAIAPASGPVLLLWEGSAEPLGTERLDTSLEEVRLVIGPEGGFSEVEVELATVAGARPVSLGPAILRTETAALAGAVLVLGRLGRLG
jgi:16S rRNA (uracil1498-N3)-methyltransferase